MNTKNNALLGMLDTVVKIAFVIAIVVIILRGSKLAYNYGYQIFNQKPVSSGEGRTVTITVESGEGSKAIGAKLAEAGLITDKNLFFLQEKFSEYSGMEKPGEYELSTSMTPEQMLEIMAGGEKAGSKSDEEDEEVMKPTEMSEDAGEEEEASGESEESEKSEDAEESEGTESPEEAQGD